jgi:hypothetical protein
MTSGVPLTDEEIRRYLADVAESRKSLIASIQRGKPRLL